MHTSKNARLRRSAFCLRQNDEHPLYIFYLTSDELMQVADLDRVGRDDAGRLKGYQRSEVRRHVEDIAEYLKEDSILFPNAIILAFSPSVKFERDTRRGGANEAVSSGTLQIPLPAVGTAKPGWIVDGQQRTLALRKAGKADFPVPISAFVADDVDMQRDQFLRINSTQPLPRGLVTEILSQLTSPTTSRLEPRRIASIVCDRLQEDEASPFAGLIRRPSMSLRNAVIADSSIVGMVEESISNPSGCLFAYRNVATGDADIDGMTQVVSIYWRAVSKVFSKAWGKPPRESRLMHGVGIRSMGRLMDRVMAGCRTERRADELQVRRDVAFVEPVCCWTSGHWPDLGGLSWDELQNVPRHIRMLSELLIRTYMRAKGRVA